MNIPKGTDLGASFERLKKSMNEASAIITERKGEGLVDAYAKLYANVEHFVNEFKDPEQVDDIPKELFTKPNAE